MKIACISLGCPKNQVDLDVMVHILLSAGHETVADLADADVILVNTCGFIESAKTEAIENIPPGFRARETYTRRGPDAFDETFELAEPGKDFEVYSRTRFTRVRTPR